MFKFNDKLYLISGNKPQPVTVVGNKVLTDTSKKAYVEDNQGSKSWVLVENLISLQDWLQAQPQTQSESQAIQFTSTAGFIELLKPLMQPEAIKALCDRLLALPMFSTVSEKTKMQRLSGDCNKFVNAMQCDLVEGKNAFYQTRQDGSQWLRHLYFKYMGIADYNWTSDNKKAADKVISNLNNQIAGLDCDRYEQSVSQLLQSINVWEIGAGLIAASGRRSIEIIEVGQFQVEGDGLLFGGQAKKRGEQSDTYSIPLIGCDPNLFVEKVATFRDSYEVQKFRKQFTSDDGEIDLKKLSDPITKQVCRRGIVPALTWLPVAEGKVAPTASDLRAAWMTVVEQKFKPEGKYSLLFRAEVLGHKLDVGSMPTLNYSRYAKPTQQLDREKCLEPSNFSQESADSDSDLSQLAALSLQEPAKSLSQPELYTEVTGPIPQLSQISEISKSTSDNLTASSGVVPARISADVEREQDLTGSDLPSGGKCSESSTMQNPPLLDGRMLREHCLVDVERLLPASEWLVIKSKAQSCYREISLERRTNGNEYSLLPTPTTYPKGSKPEISPAGRNRLESKLRSLLPTPRANDGTQGHNTGKTGGVNLTGILKRDRLLMPGEMANPQLWGWMMGFSPNWCESVLMPGGLKVLADLDGGSEISPLPELASPAKVLSVAENPSTTMELLASQPKQSPLPSESNILPVDAVASELLPQKSENLPEQPQPTQLQPEKLAIAILPATQIKAISLHQPWASLIASQHKRYETRSWSTNYRGPIAIHAAKKLHEDPRLLTLLGESEIPIGAVVAIADLTDCIKMNADFIKSQSVIEKMCGDWSVGRFAWKLENIRAIEPIEQRGYQGLWDWTVPADSTIESVSTMSENLEIAPITPLENFQKKCPNDYVSAIAPEKIIEPIIHKSVSPVNGRHKLDFYETPVWMTLLALANVPLSGVIGECCVGHGAIASILSMTGHAVWTNDIDIDKPADYYIDATDVNQWENLPPADWIITNPPYSDKAAPIVKASYSHAKRGIVMILRQNWMEVCDDRCEFLKLHPPTMLINVPRFCYRKGKPDAKGKSNWATDQCPTWLYIWDKKITSGMTKIISLADKDIPLFHRTPDTAPSLIEIEAEVVKYRLVESNDEVMLPADKFAKIGDFIALNQSLQIADRWLISGPIVALVCSCSSKLASDWVRNNRGQIDLLNAGLGTYHNRGRSFKNWLAKQ